MTARALLAAAAATLAAAAPAAAQVPAGATHTETYIPTRDGERLHLSVLRPKGLPEDARTPVIAIVSPYLKQSEGRPNPRFNDLIAGAKVFERGYSVVLADLRGTGGSSGCLDILGPGEQEDIRATVEWAAAQPWSNGRVGMYGKSYDGNTGVAGAAIRPKGLHAVVAQAVVGDRYSGSYSMGVRYLQSVAYPLVSYGTQAEAGFATGSDPEYVLNSVSRSADCQAGLADHYNPNQSLPFWRVRDFVQRGQGSKVPMLMTVGFLDNNTNVGAKALQFFEGLRGPKRLWLGWWAHDRGNDTVGGRLAMGREGWFDEVVRFYDEHLKGIRPKKADPAVVVQGSDGTWRSEDAWPPADATPQTAPLRAGSYADDGTNQGSADTSLGAGGLVSWPGSGRGKGVWTLSPPLPRDAHVAGTPRASVDVAPQLRQANLVVNVYDVDEEGGATMITRGARLVDRAGPAGLELYPTDWRIPAGHRIGVLVSGANNEAYSHVPTRQTVTVAGGTIRLPFLGAARGADQPGEPSPRLESYRDRAPFAVPAAALEAEPEQGLVPPAARGAR
jgi:uncharacterized protein